MNLILAHSPQAKGRVERRNGLLQDRLVKELRLAGISEVEAANTFLRERFLPGLNRRFTVAAVSPADVHQRVPGNLKEVLGWEDQRVVQRDWTVAWAGRWFQIPRGHEGLNLPGRSVTVRRLRDGTLHLLYRGQRLQWKELPARPAREAREQSDRTLAPRKALPAAPEHPWRRYAAGRVARAAAQEKKRKEWRVASAEGFRSASATLRPPSIPPPMQTGTSTRKGTFSRESNRGHF